MTNPAVRGARRSTPIHRLGHAAAALLAAVAIAVATISAFTVPATAAVDRLRLTFAPTETSIPDDQRAPLAAVAGFLRDDPGARVRVTAFAAAADDSYARRLSLSRGLSVRAFLIDSGISADRIHLRALGPDTDQGPRDRVDVVIVHP